MKELPTYADRLACLLYKSYLGKIEIGISTEDAKYVGGSDDIQQAFYPNESVDDVDEMCRVLDRDRYVDADYADDMAYAIWLSDDAIVYMENRFKDGIVGVEHFLSDFIQ